MPYETEVLDLLKQWAPDVTRVLRKAGYFNLPEGIEKEKIAEQIGFGRGTPLYRKLTSMSLEKNKKIADIVLNEVSLRGFKAGARVVAKQLDIPFEKYDWNPLAQTYYEEHGNELIKTLTQTDIKLLGPQIQENFALAPDACARRYADSYGCSEARQERIKRTETHTSTQNGSFDFAKTAGAEYATWHCTHIDKWPREDHAINEGQTVKIGDEFNNGQVVPEDPNCRCYITYHFEKPEKDQEIPEDWIPPEELS